MVTNFENETAPLNELETQAAEIIAQTFLKHHVGIENVVSSARISQGMAHAFEQFRIPSNSGADKSYLNGARVRKIVNRLRVEGRVPLLLANNNGYYVADNPQEVVEYIQSLQERTTAMLAVINALTQQYTEKYGERV